MCVYEGIKIPFFWGRPRPPRPEMTTSAVGDSDHSVDPRFSISLSFKFKKKGSPPAMNFRVSQKNMKIQKFDFHRLFVCLVIHLVCVLQNWLD